MYVIKHHKTFHMRTLWIYSILILTMAFGLTACLDEKFDAPPHEKPEYQGQANITIRDFKAKYNSELVQITEDDVITGIVTANDISGNLYKKIFIEDETGGLMLAIDRNNIYNDIRVGQRVFIEAKGLYMGKYGGMHQLGFRF